MLLQASYIVSILLVGVLVSAENTGLSIAHDENIYESNILSRSKRNAAKTYTFTGSLKNAIVEIHNEVRRSVQPPAKDMRKMHWDDELARMASVVSEKCSGRRIYPTGRHSRFEYIGVNTYAKRNMAFNAEMPRNVMNEWQKGKRWLTTVDGRPRCSKGYDRCDNYKQVVWASTFLVGCGASRCPEVTINKVTHRDATFVICYYAPKGNAFGRLPYTEGISPCSKCFDPTDTCSNKLCDNTNRLKRSKTPSQWLEWGQWSACSKSCGFGGSRRRYRKCSSYVQAECIGTGTSTQIFCSQQGCQTLAKKTWSRWSSWSSCSKTCGKGKRTKTRSCLSTKKSDCVGSNTREFSCYLAICSTGGWSKWGAWDRCTKECGVGRRSRRRSCSSTKSSCPGRTMQTFACNVAPCTKEAKPTWGQWQSWSRCTKTCDGGRKLRYRRCSSTLASACSGRITQQDVCNTNGCSNNKGWAAWNPWTKCSKSCGRGTQSKRRTCHGKTCIGQSYIQRFCNRQACQKATGWAPWKPWSSCNISCGGGRRTRQRTCKGGRGRCPGRGSIWGHCNTRACPRNG